MSLSLILVFTHTVWPRSQSCYSSIKGPCGSGAALSNACVLFDPILDFKGRHLIPALGEEGAVGRGGGHGEGQWAGSTMFVIDGYRQNPGPLSLPFSLSVCLSLPWILFQQTGKDGQAIRWVGVELVVFSYVKSSTSGASFINHAEFCV